MHFSFLKKLVLVHFFVSTSFSIFSQNYVDLIKFNYGNVFNAGYENSDAKTDVQLMDISLVYPIKLNEKVAIISGVDYSQQNLALFPDNETTSLNSITLKAGISIKHTEKLSGTYVLLPRLSSEDLHTDGDEFFFGGIALLKYQKTAKFQWRFGAYGSSEAFGVLVTPIIGLHYLSENKKLEITANLPINADVNYTLNDKTAIGFGLLTPVKSYNLKNTTNTTEYYTQVSNIEFGPYFETRFLDNSLLLRIHAGYSTVEYEVYEEGDVIPFRLSAFEFGDRNLLNPEMSGNMFAKAGLIYRFHLNKNK